MNFIKEIIKNIKFNSLKKWQRLFIAFCAGLFFILTIMVCVKGNPYAIALVISFLLFFVILFYLMLKKKKILFEPIYLFSFYYLTVCISIWYLIYTNFETNIFVNNTSYNSDFAYLFTLSVGYYLIGYIFTLLGYYTIRAKDDNIYFIFENKNKITDTALNVVIISFFMIGVVNFFYNVWIFANGNIFTYLAGVSYRTEEFATGGTTLGYVFSETALFVWFFKLLRKDVYYNKPFIACFAFYFIIKFSTGRIFQTILLLGSFIGIYYFIQYSKSKKINNSKFFMIGAIILLLGVGLYFVRMLSNLNVTHGLNNGIFSVFESFIKQIGYIGVDRGNLPNVAIMPKILDSWNQDIGFLYGKSLVCWVNSFFPSFLNLDIASPAIMIKETWFAHIQGGNLPPTGVGEMYANFGIFGPFIGMYFFGIFSSFVYRFIIKTKNYWVLSIMIQIIIGFITLYPKGEFSNLSLWTIFPIVCTYLLLRFLSRIQNIKRKGDS